MKRFALLLASVAFVTPALAADVVYEEPPAPQAFIEPPASGWSGFYVGGQAGLAFGGGDNKFRISTDFPNDVVIRHHDDDTGFTGGGHVGYDYQMGNFIVGAVADLNYLDHSPSSSYTLADPSADGATYKSGADVKYFGTVRGKAGVATDQFALYATGGLAYGKVDANASGSRTFTSVSGTDYDVSSDSDHGSIGYSVGAGVDFLATENVSFGLEYLYTDLGSSKTKREFTAVGATAAADPDTFSTRTKTDADFHTVMAKASYRFH